MMTLTQLANLYHSDKGDTVGCCHRYASLYETILAPFRDKPISFLEIGLQRDVCQHQPDCPSLRMWLDFFPQGDINGFDISDFSDVQIDRATIFQGDQGDPAALQSVAEKVGPFDVIIDDGSHASHHQQITVGNLFSHLKPGGLFIIEDTHWQPQRQAEVSDGVDTTLEVFKRFAIDGQPLQSSYFSESQRQDLEQNIFRCTFSHPCEITSPSQSGQRSAVRNLVRRFKGKKDLSVRPFKLIVLEKQSFRNDPGCESVNAQLM
ncbi:MAG: hypothetical protein AB8B91_00800 [Rubripirellula sp.]